MTAFSVPPFLLVGTRYLPHVDASGGSAALYLSGAFVAHFASLPLLIGAALLPLALLLPSRAVVPPLGALAIASALALLGLDTIVYDRYRFHLSGFVWELLTGPGAGDMFAFSAPSMAVAAGVVGIAVTAVLIATGLALRTVAERRLLGVGKYLFSAWATIALGSHLMHAWYEAHYDAGITSITRHFPLYHPLTAKRAFVDLGWIDPSAVREARLVEPDQRIDAGLRYPAATLECRAPEAPLNVLVVVIDALRADAFTDEIMPRLHARAERDDALLFTDHHSGGNVTKSGIFSLFYGLSAAYWDAFAAAGRGAEWIRQHQAAGYRMGIFSSATLQSPAFDRTVFASVPALRLRGEGQRPAERDRDSIAALERFALTGAPDTPWFGFLFLDSAHGYDVPTGYDKFRPQWQSVDHVKLNPDFDPEPYVNRYRNALHFLDESVADMLDRLAEHGKLDDTLVVLTSDHGEEFNDLGQNYWGHGSNFAAYQTKVPLLMSWPGKRARTVRHRTSHFDVAPTLMKEVLGCINPASDYAMGDDLFDAESRTNWLLVHSYFNYGVVTDKTIVTTYPVGSYEVRDLAHRPVDGAELDLGIGPELLHEVTRFYR